MPLAPLVSGVPETQFETVARLHNLFQTHPPGRGSFAMAAIYAGLVNEGSMLIKKSQGDAKFPQAFLQPLGQYREIRSDDQQRRIADLDLGEVLAGARGQKRLSLIYSGCYFRTFLNIGYLWGSRPKLFRKPSAWWAVQASPKKCYQRSSMCGDGLPGVMASFWQDEQFHLIVRAVGIYLLCIR